MRIPLRRGFKTQSALESSFGEHLVARLSSINGDSDNNIGPGSFMTVNSSEYTDFTQGNMESTGRNVDMALNGDGFFLVENEAYGPVLTRSGQFEIDSDGELSLPGVGKVLNDGEDTISLDSSNFTVSSSGVISVDGEGSRHTVYREAQRGCRDEKCRQTALSSATVMIRSRRKTMPCSRDMLKSPISIWHRR